MTRKSKWHAVVPINRKITKLYYLVTTSFIWKQTLMVCMILYSSTGRYCLKWLDWFIDTIIRKLEWINSVVYPEWGKLGIKYRAMYLHHHIWNHMLIYWSQFIIISTLDYVTLWVDIRPSFIEHAYLLVFKYFILCRY